MEVVNVFYKNGMPPVVSRAIEHDGKFYEMKFETRYHGDKTAVLDQIPQEKIDRTAPVHDRPSEIELVLMKALIERPEKIMVTMPIQIRKHHQNI